jgi:2-polyprenyl-6-methoxyphenol hydroxylase-like FAD-dependent oxidoreductase
LTISYVAAPRDAFGAFRADPEGELLRALDRCGDLGERARAARRAERVFGTADTQNRFHVPHGDCWALVGDAGLVMDPVTGQGIAHAFRDAELLSAALVDGLGGARPLGAALAQYREARDRATSDMYDMTLDLVRFAPPGPEQELLLAALADRPEEITRFLGAITGALPAADVFGPRALLRLLGLRGMLKAGRARRRVAA